MLRLNKIAKKSKVTVVRIKFEGETFLFNLAKEVEIKRVILDSEIIHQPPMYSFLTTLHKRLISRVKQLEVDMERVYAERFIYFLTSNKSGYYTKVGSAPSPTVAKELVRKDKEYLTAIRSYLKAEEEKDIIEGCVKAFEQRAFLLQTLSANNRKQIN